MSITKEHQSLEPAERLINLGYAISYYRKRKHLSQEEMAEKLSISRQHPGAIEAPNMQRGLSIELLFRIADVLELEPYLLLKFNPER